MVEQSHSRDIEHGRFEPGDHLRVRRPLGYWHHGIYASDERVIQFGGRICDKPDARIEAVALEKFEDGGVSEAVEHSGGDRFGVWHPKADPRELIVQRAEWLLVYHPAGWYNLVGWNCEHAANWCVNEFTESFQIRGIFGVRAVVGMLLLFGVAVAVREGKRLPSWALHSIEVYELAGAVAIVAYNLSIRRFWKDLGHRWRAEQGPRWQGGLAGGTDGVGSGDPTPGLDEG